MIRQGSGNRTWPEASRAGCAKGVGYGERGRSFRMALPGGANRIDGAMSVMVPGLPSGARTPRANRIFGWLVPNQSGTSIGLDRNRDRNPDFDFDSARSHAPAWERCCGRSSGQNPSSIWTRLHDAGASGLACLLCVPARRQAPTLARGSQGVCFVGMPQDP